MSRPKVVAVMFDGMSSFHLSIPCLIFGQDRQSLGLPAFDFRIFGTTEGPLHTDSGFIIPCEHDVTIIENADIVIIPSWDELDRPPSGALSAALKKAHDGGAVIAGLCLGAFPLAASGMLDGRKATTHWAYAEQLAALYPAVTIDPKVLYIAEGRIYTSAGVAAGLDCCLHIVRELYGAETATQLARHIVMSPHRLGGQAQLIEMPVSKPGRDDRFAAILDAVRTNLHQPHSLDGVAAAANMTRRTFTRRFQAAHALSFGAWLIQERCLLARRLLETTDLGIEDIALQAGFGTPVTLRTHFGKQFGISPALYRRGFSERSRPLSPRERGLQQVAPPPL